MTEAVDSEGELVGSEVSWLEDVGSVLVDWTGVDVGRTVVCAVVEAWTVVRDGVVKEV